MRTKYKVRLLLVAGRNKPSSFLGGGEATESESDVNIYNGIRSFNQIPLYVLLEAVDKSKLP